MSTEILSDPHSRDEMLTPRQARELKIESLVAMAGGLAHDFNNFIAAIVGNNNIIMRTLAPGSPVRRNAEYIESSALQAMDLTNSLLYFSARASMDFVDVNLHRLIEEMLPDLKLAGGRNVELVAQVSPECPAITADETQISTVVRNLVTNACEALQDTPNGGRVIVSAGPMQLDAATLQLAFFETRCSPGPAVYIEVTDDGRGMTPSEMSRMFDPFYSTKIRARGMGLPVVLGIVRAHEGAILVNSEPEKGTRVRIVFTSGRE